MEKKDWATEQSSHQDLVYLIKNHIKPKPNVKGFSDREGVERMARLAGMLGSKFLKQMLRYPGYWTGQA